MLTDKLSEHNRYLNRPATVNSLQKDLNLAFKDAKKHKAVQAGCIAWQPSFKDEEGREKAQGYKALLTEHNSLDKELSNAYFDASYPLQRFEINQNLDQPDLAKKIFSDWPSLYVSDYAYLHFSKLTGKSIEQLGLNFEKYASSILAVAFEPVNENKDVMYWQVVKLIFKQFQEELESLFQEVKVCKIFSKVRPLYQLI